MRYVWKMKPAPDSKDSEKLARELGVSRLISDLLAERGIRTFDEAKQFFRPDMSHLHDPMLMKDMRRAVDRVQRALKQQERILIYGDYDVDGTTAVALVYNYLKSSGADCGYYIPDRYSEGYGISFKGIDYAKEQGFSLIIALDCGIKSIDKISYASEKKIDFIICDHHRPGDALPAAVAVLDPKRKDCEYPYKELSGCGIGFKLVQALHEHNGGKREDLQAYLDLVAVSIGADIVPVTGENRTLAALGLKIINTSPRLGFRAMKEVAGVRGEMNISDVVFIFAPRINAAGRLEHGKRAVELLTTGNIEDASLIANEINTTNQQRRDIDKAITLHAYEILESIPDNELRKSTVVHHDEWHKGVVGIVASRLSERWYRPTIVLTTSNGKITGSARSVKDFDIYEAIAACSDLLEQFGGHAFAAGLTMAPENLPAFQQRFEEVVAATITEDQLTPEIQIDRKIALHDIDDKFLRILKQFAPFGPGNMNPVFLARHVCDRGWARLVGSNHIKCDFIEPEYPDRIFPAIAFNLGEKYALLQNKNEVDICFTIEENEWNGKKNLQLNVKDFMRS